MTTPGIGKVGKHLKNPIFIMKTIAKRRKKNKLARQARKRQRFLAKGKWVGKVVYE